MEEELNPYDDEVLNSDINLLKPEEILSLIHIFIFVRGIRFLFDNDIRM